MTSAKEKQSSSDATGSRLPWQVMAVALIGAASLLPPAAAQPQPRKYGPNDEVSDGTYVYKIIRCQGDDQWDECEYQAYRDGVAAGSKGRMTIRNLRAAEQRVLDARRRAEGPGARGAGAAPLGDSPPVANRIAPALAAVAPAANAREVSAKAGPVAGADGSWKVGDRLEVNDRAFWYPAQVTDAKGGKYRVHFDGYPSSDDQWVDASRMRPLGGHQVSAQCNYEASGPAVTAQSRFSEALAKRKIHDEYAWKANGTLSAPLKVGVTFLSFKLGGSYTNTVANVPGYGAQRKHAGAPVNATIYTFTSKRLVCEQYRDGVKRRLVEGSSACFVDKDGSWTCPSESDTKISRLD